VASFNGGNHDGRGVSDSNDMTTQRDQHQRVYLDVMERGQLADRKQRT
jgi:hypothetical protein